MKVKVGYRDYTIKFVNKIDGDSDTQGHTDSETGIIKIRKGQQKKEKYNTVWHEILHAIFNDRGIIMDDKEEEKLVSSITNGQIAFMRENPQFMRKFIHEILDEIKK